MIIKCLECGAEISDKAQYCVKCGNPMRIGTYSKSQPNLLGIRLLCVLGFICVFCSCILPAYDGVSIFEVKYVQTNGTIAAILHALFAACILVIDLPAIIFIEKTFLWVLVWMTFSSIIVCFLAYSTFATTLSLGFGFLLLVLAFLLFLISALSKNK